MMLDPEDPRDREIEQRLRIASLGFALVFILYVAMHVARAWAKGLL